MEFKKDFGPFVDKACDAWKDKKVAECQTAAKKALEILGEYASEIGKKIPDLQTGPTPFPKVVKQRLLKALNNDIKPSLQKMATEQPK